MSTMLPLGSRRTKAIRLANLTMLINTYGIDRKPAEHLQKLARSLRNSNEKECNYGLTPRQAARARNLWIQAQAIAGHFNLHVREQGDPRGWPIEISKAPMEDSRQYDQVCPL